jgi:hypothetical protein
MRLSRSRAIADFQLLYPGTIGLKRLFPQEKATFQNANEAAQIGIPLYRQKEGSCEGDAE